MFRRALSFFRPDLPKISATLVMIAVAEFFAVLGPWPLAILIDTLGESSGDTGWQRDFLITFIPAGSVVKLIVGVAAASLVIALSKELLQMVQSFLSIQIGYYGELRVRSALYQKLQAMSLAYHKSQPQGDTLYRLTRDTSGFGGMYKVATGVLTNGLRLAFMTWFMITIDWRLTLIALTVVPVLLVSIKLFGKLMHERSMAAYEHDAKYYTNVQRSVGHIGLVQAFNREADEFRRFHTSAHGSVAAYLRLHWQEVLYWFVLGSTIAVGSSLILGVGGYFVYQKIITMGQLTVFLSYLGMLYAPLSALVGSNQGLQTGMAGVKRVFEVLDRDPIVHDKPGAMHLPTQPRTLTLDGLSFGYKDGQKVLDNVTATIAPGQMVAFVGPSGVGKTTLLNLLPRFFDPKQGAMRLDGHDLRDIKLADVRRHIALVLQDNTVLPATVAENISYGRPDATLPQIQAAAAAAGAADFIDQLDGKYEAEISEQGGNLSGGQRQRIGIARALLTEAPILVLDEPTSALDAHNERLINETLLSLKGTRTILLVSHRLSSVIDADKIFVMHAGRIIEQGTHAELVASRGHYYQMAKHQLRLEESDGTTERRSDEGVNV